MPALPCTRRLSMLALAVLVLVAVLGAVLGAVLIAVAVALGVAALTSPWEDSRLVLGGRIEHGCMVSCR